MVDPNKTPGGKHKKKRLKVLILQDNPKESALMLQELRKGAFFSCDHRIVDNRDDFLSELDCFLPHVILASYSIQGSSCMEALEIKKKRGPNLPFIIVTDSKNEETAVACVKAGADDYIVKESLHCLRSAVLSALEKRRLDNAEKKVQSQLEEAVKQWATTFDSVTDPIALLDPQGKVLRCNQAACEFIGKSLEGIVGRVYLDFLKDSPGRIGELPLQRALKSFAPETEIIQFQNRYFSIAVDPTPKDAVEPTGFVHVMRDITEHVYTAKALEASELKYRTLFEGAVEGIMVADAETRRCLYANPAACRLLGYSSEEIRELGVEDLHEQKDLSRVLRAFEDQVKGIISLASEIHFLRKDGRIIIADVQSSPIHIDGRLCNLGFLKDVTQQKRLEKEKEKVEKQFLHAQRLEAVGRLAGGVAHDFNNLLSVISGYAELALDTLQREDPLFDNLEEILGAGKRAAALTRQLLAFSRQQVFSQEVLCLNSVVANIEKMLRRLIGEHIKLVTSLDERLDKVIADPGQLEQVIMNLAVNARDAMPGGGILTIETGNTHLEENYAQTHHGAKAGPHVMLMIRDTGFGMDEETMGHAFEPFFTTKEQGAGTGLGLSTVYGIIKQSGGSVWVYSEPGEGTVFKVYLPKFEGDQLRRKISTAPSVHSGGTERILIVEDDATLRKMVGQMLSSAGYEVMLTSHGDEALMVLERAEKPVHLILTDMVMPGMSGRELTDELQRLHPRMKVLYMSGYPGGTVSNQEISDMDACFIAKPFGRNEILEKVRSILDEMSVTTP